MTDAPEIVSNERIELDMLRAFYQSWIGLHKIPRDKLHRRKQEAAAQLLVDNAHTVQRFYDSMQPEKASLRLVEVPANA
jgi:hypothetical protein